MNEFQKLVQDSLKHAEYYIYHPTDFNIAHSNAHLFTVAKEADYISGCPHTGRIFWVEAKDTKGKRFYHSSGKNARQFQRALMLDEIFHTYFYVVNFSELGVVAYFNPTLVKDSNHFDLAEYDGLRITRTTQVTESAFGQRAKRNLLDMSFLTDLLVGDAVP